MAAIKDAVQTAGSLVGIVNSLEENKRQNARADMDEEFHQKRMKALDQQYSMTERKRKQEELVTFGGALKEMMDRGEPISPGHVARFMDLAELDPVNFFSEQYQNNFQVADSVFKGKVKGNSPEALEAANNLFRGKIMQGNGYTKDGKRIVDKRITGMYPSKDGKSVLFDLTVTDEDGKSYESPLTDNRDSDPEKDPYVKEVPIENLMSNIAGQRLVWNMFNQQQFKTAVSGYMAGLNGMNRHGTSKNMADLMALETLKSDLRSKNDQESDARDAKRQKELGASNATFKRITEKAKTLDETPDDIIRLQERVNYGIASEEEQKKVDDYARQSEIKLYMQEYDTAKQELDTWYTDEDKIEPVKIWQKVNEKLLQRRGQGVDFNLVATMGMGGGALQDQAPEAPAASMSALTPAQSTEQPESGTASSSVVKVTNKAEYEALPSGTRYLHPDGTVKVKK